MPVVKEAILSPLQCRLCLVLPQHWFLPALESLCRELSLEVAACPQSVLGDAYSGSFSFPRWEVHMMSKKYGKGITVNLWRGLPSPPLKVADFTTS